MSHLHQPKVGFKCNWTVRAQSQGSLLYFTLRPELHSLSVLPPDVDWPFPLKCINP